MSLVSRPLTKSRSLLGRLPKHGDGSIVVEPVWHAAGDTADWDQAVARLVTSGDLEMGLIRRGPGTPKE